MQVFAYGSLLNPASLVATLPDVDLTRCVPGVCEGYERAFTVAFPNDGSEPDKAYVDGTGHRPPVILFADLVAADSVVNGICIPVGDTELARLRARELRYELIDVAPDVVAFVGRAEFTRPDDVARGVVPAGYLGLVMSGVAYWDERHPGFAAGYARSTRAPRAVRDDLTRVDR